METLRTSSTHIVDYSLKIRKANVPWAEKAYTPVSFAFTYRGKLYFTVCTCSVVLLLSAAAAAAAAVAAPLSFLRIHVVGSLRNQYSAASVRAQSHPTHSSEQQRTATHTQQRFYVTHSSDTTSHTAVTHSARQHINSQTCIHDSHPFCNFLQSCGNPPNIIRPNLRRRGKRVVSQTYKSSVARKKRAAGEKNME